MLPVEGGELCGGWGWDGGLRRGWDGRLREEWNGMAGDGRTLLDVGLEKVWLEDVAERHEDLCVDGSGFFLELGADELVDFFREDQVQLPIH